MKTLIAITVLGLGVFLAGSVAAQGRIYKWVDAQGRIHYSDTPTRAAEAVDDILPPSASFTSPSGPQPETSTEASAEPSDTDDQATNDEAGAGEDDEFADDQLGEAEQPAPSADDLGFGEEGPMGEEEPLATGDGTE